MPPGMGVGHRMTRKAVFNILVVADAKCQQAWGKHKVSAQLIKVWEDAKGIKPKSAHRQREDWL